MKKSQVGVDQNGKEKHRRDKRFFQFRMVPEPACEQI
jgi:hypothetical protein